MELADQHEVARYGVRAPCATRDFRYIEWPGDPGKETAMETDNDIERQIKELERDKRLEEIKQLRADAKTRWITPAFLIALLPILGTFGWWGVEQLKQ
jgi:hypothetical protein